MKHSRSTGLLAVLAQRPPEIEEIGGGSDWKFETQALANDFRKFELTALASSRPTISIFDYIGDDGEGGGVTEKKIAAILRQIGNKPITVEINSPGGNYFVGVAIYNLLRRHSQPITVQVLGIAASAASVIAMAGDEVQIAHNAELMIHEARGLFFGTKSEMRAGYEQLARVDNAMTSTYAARSGRDKAEFDAMIADKDMYFRGQEAIDIGLADTLLERDAQMPVYAAAEDFPSDKPSLDRYFAKQGMPRSARRDLYRAIGTQNAADPATPSAGNEPQADYSRLLEALTV